MFSLTIQREICRVRGSLMFSDSQTVLLCFRLQVSFQLAIH